MAKDKDVVEEFDLEEEVGAVLKAEGEDVKAPEPVTLEVKTVPNPKDWGDANDLAQLRGAVRFLASKFGDQAMKELKDLFPALGD
jgi:hypothetical protein